MVSNGKDFETGEYDQQKSENLIFPGFKDSSYTSGIKASNVVYAGNATFLNKISKKPWFFPLEWKGLQKWEET